MTLPDVHYTKAEMQAFFSGHDAWLPELIVLKPKDFKSIMSQVRWVGVVGQTSISGAYTRKELTPLVRFLASIKDSLDMHDWHKFRYTLRYMRAAYKKAPATERERRRIYNQRYIAKKRREKRGGLMRIKLGVDVYKELVQFLDDNARPDLSEALIVGKVDKE